MPREYVDDAAEKPGRVAEIGYRTDYQGEEIQKEAFVYLPSGYDGRAARRYDVLYFMHGAGMNAESFFGRAGGSTPLKNLVDHLIEDGRMPPTIIVSPTFYPGDDSSLDLHYAGELDRAFPRELETDLMPAVESRYRTYAESADAAGFVASRTHRAFGGFSMGGVTTWYVFQAQLDQFAYFMPMAGDSWVVADSGGAVAPERTADRLAASMQSSGLGRDDFLIAASVGSSDGTLYQMQPQIDEMRTHTDSFDDSNLVFILDEGGGHDLGSVQRQFYRSAQLLFRLGDARYRSVTS